MAPRLAAWSGVIRRTRSTHTPWTYVSPRRRTRRTPGCYTTSAIRREGDERENVLGFQRDYGLQATGELDEPTKAKLHELHESCELKS